MSDEGLVEALTVAVHALRDRAAGARWQLTRIDVPNAHATRLRLQADVDDSAAETLLTHINALL